MEEETEKLDVEELEDVSDPSADEQDLEDLSQEELIALVQKKEEARKTAISHLREQQKKRKETPKVQEESTTEAPAAIPDLDKLIEQKVQEVTKQSTIERFAQGGDDWLYSQSWGKDFAPETEGSERMYAKLAIERDRLLKEHNVQSVKDYRKVVALAAVNVTGKPDALIETPAHNYEADYQRSIASASGGSSSGVPSKKALTAREIEIANKFGHNPEEVYN